MITGEIKNKIDSLWDLFASGGVVNPLEVIEQVTYLMFIHDLDRNNTKNEAESVMLDLPFHSIYPETYSIETKSIDGNALKWSVFRDFPADKMFQTVSDFVFPFIKGLDGNKNSGYSKYMSDASFKLPTPLLLSEVVESLDLIYNQMEAVHDADIRGDVYEYLLSKIAQSGLNGQFRTPRHIIKMMVALMDPTPTDIICDPACGTSGFLVASGEYLREHKKEAVLFDKTNKAHYMNEMFHGFDTDRTMLRIGAMNMMTHGVQNPSIEYRDSLSDQNPDREKYSLILANPPFKGSLKAEIVSEDLLKTCKTKKTELLFVALITKMLDTGGRCAMIVPDGVLFGGSKAHQDIRKDLVENQRLVGVISLPSGVFKPYAGVSTGILIFTKTGHGGTDSVWFYDMQADGFSLDDKRAAVSQSDIPDIVARFHNLEGEQSRERTEKSFCVLKAEIVENGYDLSVNKYKKTVYVAEKFPPTAEILADIAEMEEKISEGLKLLGGLR
ncbi:MAG: class I SAM-dependent DNA methyltransferase [Eubacteriales bacterium]